MGSVWHIAEVALLILIAYLLGCVIGYVARRIVYARSEDRALPATLLQKAVSRPLPAPVQEVAVVTAGPVVAESVPAPVPRRPRKAPSAARRLARAAAEDDDTERVPGAAARQAQARQAGPATPGQPQAATGDLRKIKGMARKSESALHALGAFQHDQAAALEAARAAWPEGDTGAGSRQKRSDHSAGKASTRKPRKA